MSAPRYKLWIDGVGCWNVVFGTEWTVGGPGSGATLELLAPLDATPVTIASDGDQFLFDGNSLAAEETLVLTSDVALRFRQPHVWSTSATLEPASPHRAVDHADGVLLASGPCVLGPDEDAHVRCADWSHAIVLFEQNGLCWKRFDGPRDGNVVNRLGDGALWKSGPLIETDEARLSVEAI